ncbi:peptidase U32 family protein [Vagococcus vulneris]|uniref:Peptidase U32 n=1 Tax=Vagococcus vulneris TaxID=1977869 RepID=A0A429ZY90_9ENTE|nr:peptidase U32 family protein [Vagococcus vulneris]RST98911.1 peptidase U32 [Vagococcus vulneris]
MPKIITTVESLSQAKQLVELNIDYIYTGDANFGLRLPTHFERHELKELTDLTHAYGKKIRIAVNGIMHPEKMEELPEYLAFLQEIGVDDLVVGDPGVIYVLNRDKYHLPFIYDAATMVTSSRQINFWAGKGAQGAVLAREIPYLELKDLGPALNIPGEMLVYGATCIHQSKRPLLENYFNFVKTDEATTKNRGLFISEPKDETTHYSIYEDQHGTHIFNSADINLMHQLGELHDMKLDSWKLDGIFTPGDLFVEIVDAFAEAKKLIEANQWTEIEAARLNEVVVAAHPNGRSLDEGFYYLNPEDIR